MGLAPLIDRKVFEQGLASRPVARSAHLNLHRVGALKQELSTAGVQPVDEPVDNLTRTGVQPPVLLGMVIPKRHAARAVTRNTIKRQIRQVAREHEASMGAGAWIFRLRAPFDLKPRGPATSRTLKAAVRAEALALLEGASRRQRPAPTRQSASRQV